MNRLREEMKLIPRPVWAIAVILSLLIVAAFVAYEVIAVDTENGFFFPMIAIGAFVFFTFTVYSLLIGYIYGDARRRGMRAGLWVLLAIFIPNAIGILLYFILREPLLVKCPQCGAGVKAAFPFCPDCGASLGAVCPSCKSAVENGWTHCARCGKELTAA